MSCTVSFDGREPKIANGKTLPSCAKPRPFLKAQPHKASLPTPVKPHGVASPDSFHLIACDLRVAHLSRAQCSQANSG